MSETFFHLLGPGTQPNDPDFHMNPLPIEIAGNSAPSMAALEDFTHITPALALIGRLLEDTAAYQGDALDYPRYDVTDLDDDNRRFLNTLLGEGEVSVIVQQDDDTELHIQESIFCGIWRVQHMAGPEIIRDSLEVCPIPAEVWQWAEKNTRQESLLPPLAGRTLMNALPLAHELLSHTGKLETPPHVINLTLLPLNEDDHHYLAELVGNGAVKIYTRGYGESQISSTRLQHVWNIRCLNNLKGILLETYEVSRIPDLAIAALEDIQDSTSRLTDTYHWLKQQHSESESHKVLDGSHQSE